MYDIIEWLDDDYGDYIAINKFDDDVALIRVCLSRGSTECLYEDLVTDYIHYSRETNCYRFIGMLTASEWGLAVRPDDAKHWLGRIRDSVLAYIKNSLF